MLSNRDARDVGGLEEVFRSDDFRRTADATSRDASGRVRPEDTIVAGEFVRPMASVPVRDARGEVNHNLLPGRGEPARPPVDETQLPGRQPHVASAETAPSKPGAPRYLTIATVSVLAVLVVAGIMAGMGHHQRPTVLAQGEHDTARPHGGSGTSGAASTGSAAPDGPRMGGSGGPPEVEATLAGLGSGTAPGGRVTLVGPASFTGTPTPPAVPGDPQGVAGGALGSTPGAGSASPAAPVAPGAGGGNATPPAASAAGSTVGDVGSSVTAAGGEIQSAVPATAPVADVTSAVVNALGLAVSSSTE